MRFLDILPAYWQEKSIKKFAIYITCINSVSCLFTAGGSRYWDIKRDFFSVAPKFNVI